MRIARCMRRFAHSSASFSLDPGFVASYRKVKAPFGFNGLGHLVYRRTYSRVLDSGENEEWWLSRTTLLNIAGTRQSEGL